jgi:hypothetical protein
MPRYLMEPSHCLRPNRSYVRVSSVPWFPRWRRASLSLGLCSAAAMVRAHPVEEVNQSDVRDSYLCWIAAAELSPALLARSSIQE